MRVGHRTRSWVALIAAVGALALGGAVPCRTAAAEEQAQDLGALLKGTTLKFHEQANNKDTWIVPFTQDGGKTLEVFITYNNDQKKFALIFATVVDKEDGYDFGKDVLVEAMKLNNDLPGVKFCLDAKWGDIDCQTEVPISALTSESLEAHLNLIASDANEYGPRLAALVK